MIGKKTSLSPRKAEERGNNLVKIKAAA
jgi:hypothetical protein